MWFLLFLFFFHCSLCDPLQLAVYIFKCVLEIEYTSWWFHLAILMLYPNILIKICEPSYSPFFIYSFFPSPSWCYHVLCILVSPCFPHSLFSVFIFVYFNRPWCRLPADRPLITFNSFLHLDESFSMFSITLSKSPLLSL